MPISGKHDNISDNIGLYKDKKSTLKEEDMKEDYKDL